jgi:hypothetical protein
MQVNHIHKVFFRPGWLMAASVAALSDFDLIGSGGARQGARQW